MYSMVAVHRSSTSSTYTMASPSKSDAPAEELANLSVAEEGATASNGSAGGAGSGDFRKTFTAFAKFGDSKSDGKGITLSQSDKWMKQAKVIDKAITTTDTGIQFKKQKQQKLSHELYNKFLDELAKAKKVEVDEIKNKMANCGAPGILSSTPGKAAATVDRLTDVKNYTGSHKERFDDSGKGKGIAGRKNLVDGSGYVSGYQHKDTYDKTH